MKLLKSNQMETLEGGAKCIYEGMAAPFMLVFSGFISSSYLDSYWGNVVDNCF